MTRMVMSRRLLVGLIVAALALVGPERLARAPRLCLWRGLSGVDCPGCGLLRGFSHLARLDAAGATRSHALALPIAGLLLFAGLRPRPGSRPRTGNSSGSRGTAQGPQSAASE